MLKKILLLAVLMSFSLNLYAHGTEWIGNAIIKDAKWSPVQISFWPVHLCGLRTTICGINLSPGLFGFSWKVYGISCGQIVLLGENNGLAANIWSFGDKNNGLAVGVFNAWGNNNGVSIGVANFVHDEGSDGISRNTLQIGVFNQANSGLQIGVLNYNPNALIPWMPLINFVIPRSVESSLKELKERPYPFDVHIKKHANQYFPDWNTEERLRWLNELFPLTDAGATYALMEAAKKYDLLWEWDDYALTLPIKKRRDLRNALGSWITQRYWHYRLETAPDGTITLTLFKMINSARCSFSAKFKDLPKNIPITVERINSDFEVGYRIEKTIKNGNTIRHISDFTTLFTVRRDAETDLWFETGSWKEIDKKTPAVTIYKELWKNSVCTEIKNSKRIYKEFRLKEQYRKIKLGRIAPEQVIQSQAL